MQVVVKKSKMAPTTSKGDWGSVNKLVDKKEPESDNDNLWASILGEVQARGNTKLATNKTLLVLGDNGSGKTTLVAKLQGVEDPTKGSGLEYAYIDVRDEYRDDSTRLGVWVLDGDLGHNNLLKYALSAETYPHTLVMLVASMTSPCSLLDQLHHWSTRLHDHLRSLNLNPDVERECRHRCVKRWQEYTEPGEEGVKRTSRSLEEDDLLPLEENVLSMNYGLDIVVAITKTDYMSQLEKEYDFREEHFDLIQYHVRNFCVQHGAALFYTSAKEDKNCDLLYKYLTHRIYGIGTPPPSLIVEKDAVLVPSGWDQANKIAILTESLNTIKPDAPYKDLIVMPPSTAKGTHREVEVVAEDDQAFLSRLLTQLQAGRMEGTQKAGDRRLTPGTPGTTMSKKIDGKTAVAGGEGVLANFFNSLLAKKTPGVGGTPPRPDGVTGVLDGTPRLDAAAELERLSRAAAASAVREGRVEDASDC